MESKTITDPRDGKVYKIVKIGEQVWMAENLNFDCPGSKCYDNDPKNAEKYGRLYDWETAFDACPDGWHLPDNDEWSKLVDFVGDKAEIFGGAPTAGKKLKAKSGWNENGNGTDKYGFSALPGGYGYSGGGFLTIGDYGQWWSSNEGEVNDFNAYYRIMFYRDDSTYWNNFDKNYLLSVRCVQDEDENEGELLEEILLHSPLLEKIPEEFKTNEFYLKAVKQNSDAIEYVPKKLKAKVKAMLKAEESKKEKSK